ncbi:hypothetical protein D3C75_912370 [compost metagenome]
MADGNAQFFASPLQFSARSIAADHPASTFPVVGGQHTPMLPALRRLISLRRIGPAGNTEQHRPDKLQRRAFSGFIAPIQDGNPLLQPDLPLLQAAKAADLQLLNPHSSAPRSCRPGQVGTA